MRGLRNVYKSLVIYYYTTYSSTGALLQVQHTTMLVVEERRFKHVDRGPGDGEFTQLQFALSSTEILSALHSMTLLDNRSVPQ